MTFLTGAGPVAAMQARLGWWLLIVSVIVVVVTSLLVLAGAFRRHPPTPDRLDHAETGLGFVVIGGMIIPAALLVMTFAFTIATENAIAAPPRAAAMTVEIVGHRWWWEVRYPGDPARTFVTANEIHVAVGTPVRLELVSADVIHSFWIPQLAGKTDLIPGQRNVAWIQADRAGDYRGACTEYCGLQHTNMASFVVAEQPEQFAQWMQRQQESAMPPGDASTAQGLAIFLKTSCASCHTIRGTGARGRVGPDLTHLASRMTIAGGALENTRGNLAGWIANPQTIKPGSVMPNTPLRGVDLQALVAYLETLK